MRLKKILKYIILLTPVLAATYAVAQPFSYVYIQGDKETPIYVKMDGKMMLRYGKNYSIISQLAPGAITLEVLFQQNIFPPEKFNIQVPEDGYCGYLLTKHEGASSGQDNHFVLYDLQKKTYLEPQDTAGEDSGEDAVAASTKANANNTTPIVNAAQNNPGQPKQNTPPSATNNQPHFIDSVELSNKRVLEPDTDHINPFKNNDENSGIVDEKQTTDNGCPNAISKEKFEDLYARLLTKNDSEKLTFLLGNLDNCFSTGQVRRLANNLIYEADKFVFIKAVYNNNKTTDESNFYTLQDIFETNSGKQSFNVLIHKY